jgi:hypothetical protein
MNSANSIVEMEKEVAAKANPKMHKSTAYDLKKDDLKR